MKESYLKIKILRAIKKEFPDTWVYKASDRFVSGIPDILCCFKGRFLAFELKTKKGKLTLIQSYILNRINKAGGLAIMVKSVSEVLNCFSLILKEKEVNKIC